MSTELKASQQTLYETDFCCWVSPLAISRDSTKGMELHFSLKSRAVYIHRGYIHMTA